MEDNLLHSKSPSVVDDDDFVNRMVLVTTSPSSENRPHDPPVPLNLVTTKYARAGKNTVIHAKEGGTTGALDDTAVMVELFNLEFCANQIPFAQTGTRCKNEKRTPEKPGGGCLCNQIYANNNPVGLHFWRTTKACWRLPLLLVRK
jgi:hypothetical protein